MNGLFRIVTAAMIAAPISGVFAASNDDIAARMAQLEKLVQQQNVRIEQQAAELSALRNNSTETRALVSDLETEVESTLDARINEGLAAMKDESVISLGKNIDGLTLKSDARFRYQIQDEGKADNDERLRLRLRLGGIWQNKSENWEFGVGLEVGSASANSANSSFNEGGTFESLDLYADYAYAKHKLDPFTLTVGQMKNPLVTTNMIWDSDIRPIGVAAQYADHGFFATVGWFDAIAGDNVGVGNNRDRYQADGTLIVGQAGFESEGESADWGIVAGYLHANEPFDAYAEGYADEDNDIQVLDAYAWLSTKVADAQVRVFGHVATNLGADGATVGGVDPSDEDLAWSVGATAKLDKLKLSYTYKHIEQFSTSVALTDSNFGDINGRTNVEGHVISGFYGLTKNISLGITTLLEEQIVGSADGETFQFDLKYKF